jgi:16S rRNA (guanine966-N2)-methyltransferase
MARHVRYGVMRVVSGLARGRALTTIESPSVRPTSDKVKEAIFSMLEAEAFKRGLAEPGYLAETEDGDGGFPWPRVLDLYAGSGALGIEALSRGAKSADFVETDARARQAIADNLRRTGLASKARIHGMRVQAALSTFSGPYDLIVLDPPYEDSAFDAVFQMLCESSLVGIATFVVLEHSRQRRAPPGCGPLALLKTRVHGRTGVSIYAMERQE